jgi:iron complex transport system substrate-binding protein
VESIAGDLAAAGRVLRQEERAGRLIDFVNKNFALVASRVKGLPAGQKPLVYWEGPADYSACGADSADGSILELAAARNIAADVRVPQPNVTPEWVLARNPEVIIKCPDTAVVSSGYGQTDDAMKQKREDIMSRPGWQKMDAVKKGNVYVLSRQIVTGPQAVIGLLYTAKWLHPGLFEDIDPSAVHGSLLKEFYGLDYNGAWACCGD